MAGIEPSARLGPRSLETRTRTIQRRRKMEPPGVCDAPTLRLNTGRSALSYGGIWCEMRALTTPWHVRTTTKRSTRSHIFSCKRSNLDYDLGASGLYDQALPALFLELLEHSVIRLRWRDVLITPPSEMNDSRLTNYVSLFTTFLLESVALQHLIVNATPNIDSVLSDLGA